MVTLPFSQNFGHSRIMFRWQQTVFCTVQIHGDLEFCKAHTGHQNTASLAYQQRLWASTPHPCDIPAPPTQPTQ